MVPGAPLRPRVTPQPQDVASHCGAETLGEQRNEGGTDPGARVSRIRIRRVLVRGERARSDVRSELGLREWKQRAHQATRAAGGNPRETRDAAPAQRAPENRFDLVVLLMRGDEVARATPLLDFAQPAVARPPRDGLRGARSKPELDGVERQPISSRQPTHPLSHVPAPRLDLMIGMRNNEVQSQLRRDLAQQVEQRYRVRPARHSHDRAARLGEKAGAGDVRAKAVEQGSHILKVTI